MSPPSPPCRAPCSFAPTANDAAILAAFAATTDTSAFPNVTRYVAHISSFPAHVRAK
jgi:hypothetical protein